MSVEFIDTCNKVSVGLVDTNFDPAEAMPNNASYAECCVSVKL